MDRRTQRTLLAASLGVLLTSCAAIQVNSDYDESFDFSGLRTWHWLPRPVPEVIDPRVHNAIVDRRVRRVVEAALATKGMRRVEAGQGDFGVGYHAAIEGKVDVRTINDFYGYGPGWDGGRGVVYETYVREYDQGTLVLDVVDASTRRLVWRGSAQAEVSPDLKPEDRDETLEKAVAKMFEGFPPASN